MLTPLTVSTLSFRLHHTEGRSITTVAFPSRSWLLFLQTTASKSMMLVPLARRLMLVHSVNQPLDRDKDSSLVNPLPAPIPGAEGLGQGLPFEINLMTYASFKDQITFFIPDCTESTIGGLVHRLNCGISVEDLSNTREPHVPELLLKGGASKHESALTGGHLSIVSPEQTLEAREKLTPFVP